MYSIIKLCVLSAISLQITECVKVSLYYEALCYDSTEFITRQLYPHYSELKHHLQLEFVPFGKAIHNYRGDKWIFDCQHGPNECKGNKYQACALALKNGQDKDVAFVYCVMRERNPADVTRMQYCANRYNISWEKISQCAQGIQGDDLLAGNGNKTFDLEPNLSFVPTVIYNDKYDDYLQELSLTDFATVACHKIKGQKPQVCENRKLPERKSVFDYFK